MDEVRVRGEPSTVWIPQTGDVLCVSRAEGWYDHTAIIIEVRGDGQWTGMDFDAFEHEEGEAAPGNRGCIFGHETEIRLIESKDFEAQYSGFNRIIEVIVGKCFQGSGIGSTTCYRTGNNCTSQFQPGRML